MKYETVVVLQALLVMVLRVFARLYRVLTVSAPAQVFSPSSVIIKIDILNIKMSDRVTRSRQSAFMRFIHLRPSFLSSICASGFSRAAAIRLFCDQYPGLFLLLSQCLFVVVEVAVARRQEHLCPLARGRPPWQGGGASSRRPHCRRDQGHLLLRLLISVIIRSNTFYQSPIRSRKKFEDPEGVPTILCRSFDTEIPDRLPSIDLSSRSDVELG